MTVEDLPKLRSAIAKTKPVTRAAKAKTDKPVRKAAKTDITKAPAKAEKVTKKTVASAKPAKTTKAASTASFDGFVASGAKPSKIDLAVPNTVAENIYAKAASAFNGLKGARKVSGDILASVAPEYKKEVKSALTDDFLSSVRGSLTSKVSKKIDAIVKRATGASAKSKLTKELYTEALNSAVAVVTDEFATKSLTSASDKSKPVKKRSK